MSAPVDVIAVLESAQFSTQSMFRALDAEAAIAAIVELVSASRDYADVEENAYDITQRIPARNRLRAALARVGGAA